MRQRVIARAVNRHRSRRADRNQSVWLQHVKVTPQVPKRSENLSVTLNALNSIFTEFIRLAVGVFEKNVRSTAYVSRKFGQPPNAGHFWELFLSRNDSSGLLYVPSWIEIRMGSQLLPAQKCSTLVEPTSRMNSSFKAGEHVISVNKLVDKGSEESREHFSRQGTAGRRILLLREREGSID